MKRIVINICIAVLLLVFLFSCFMIARDRIMRENDIKELDSIAEIVNAETSSIPETSINTPDAEEIIPTPIFKRNLKPVFEKNNDCIGWICIEGTTVDYPVMYTPDVPQKYLRKNFDEKYSISGIPFMQENCALESENVIIYGHNMKNGTMFSDICNYIDPQYLESHPTVEFETANGLVCYDVFAVACVNKNDEWYSFVNSSNSEDFDLRIESVIDRSLYDSGIVPEYGEKLLTLSTCYGKTNDDRLIVVCREQ